jgi:hypothetical protein
MTKIINLFGGPGAGKSSTASGLFFEFNKRGITCDIPYEYPKEIVWDGKVSNLNDQLYVFANQHRRIARSYGKVDYIILDSPILLSFIYQENVKLLYPSNLYGKEFNDLILNVFKSYDNINFFIERDDNKFIKNGRVHSSEESIDIDNKILTLLSENNIKYHSVKLGQEIIKDILINLDV